MADQIDAMPTKQFFVDMLIRDIPLERAVLDLVDNCIDGAKRLRSDPKGNFEGLKIALSIGSDGFRIDDNCGGFDIETAKEYAFRFGRAKLARTTPFSIGQFGVGMKRALFKFGREFEISSATATERWSLAVNVDVWEADDSNWTFEFKTTERDIAVAPADQGTSIVVKRLRPEVASRFGTKWFQNTVGEVIRIHLRQFISNGLEIRLEGVALTATDVNLLTGTIRPAVEDYDEAVGDSIVKIRIVAGVGQSLPSTAGWYVVCNGRVVLAADRSEETGWGRVGENEAGVPKFHGQFARFRGIIYFECEAADKLPWNTTKTGIDADSPIWQRALTKMIDQMRIVIDFLNGLDAEMDVQGKSGPLARALAAATLTQVDSLRQQASFTAPDKEKFSGPVLRRIAYSRPEAQVTFLMEQLGLSSAKAVGEQSFDLVLREKS